MARRAPLGAGLAALPSMAALLSMAALVGLGLYLGRVAAETLPGLRAPWEAVALTLAGFVVAWLVALMGRRLSLPVGPFALSWAYVLWPNANATLAWAVGLAMLVAWLYLAPRGRLPRYSLEGALLLFGLVLYGATVAPTVLPADSGEFQLVAAVLGIAHPPGYPLYTMLGKLATLWPFSEPALGLNLLSVLFAASTLAVTAALVRHVARARSTAWGWGSALAAGALAVSPTFWSQATTANIRSLTVLLTALCLLLLVRWARNPTPGRLALFGLALGLAIGHHSSLGLLALPMAAYVLAVDPRLPLAPRRWLPALGAFLASFVVLLYLPLRSAMGPAFDAVPIDSVARFVEHVLATGFRGDMLYYSTLPQLLERTRIYLDILRLQFGAVLPWAMLLALVWVTVRNWRLGLLLGGVWLVNAASALTYRAPQTVEYLLPSYVAMAASLGCGVALALRRIPRYVGAALVAVLSVIVVANGLSVYPDFRVLAAEQDTREYASTLLAEAPPDALVLANWHWATPIWYLQQVEGLRPELEVEYVHPEGALSNEQVWLSRMAAALEPEDRDARPVVVTNRFAAFDEAGYLLEPLGEAWLVRPVPPDVPSASALAVSVDLGERIRIEAYRPSDGSVAPGEAVRVALYWRPLRPLERDYAVFVQLVGPQGVVGQADRSQPTSSYRAGELRIDECELPLLLQTPPGTYSLIAGFYTTTADGWERLETADGIDHVVLGTIDVTVGTLRSATTRPLDVRYASGQRLVGMDVDHSVPGQTRLYLHWIGDGAASRPAQVVALGQGVPLASTTLPALSGGEAGTVVLDLATDVSQVQLRVEESGQRVSRTVGPWGLRWRSQITLRLPSAPSVYVPLGRDLVYLGLEPSAHSGTAGEPVTVRPRFMARRPVLRDYSVSVGVVDRASGWERKSDGTPAMGAIPTLKWLGGWVVSGPYAPILPRAATRSTATITVSVYDAFTLMPLAVLDERLVREGQGVHLTAGEIAIEAD